MSVTIKESSLQGCLQKLGLRALPKQETGDRNNILQAVVLTRRTNGMESYCIAENDGSGKLAITKDFGPCAAIYSILAVYPIQSVDKKILPDFRSDKQIVDYLCKSIYNKEDIERLLSKEGKSPEQIKTDRKTVKDYVVKTAIDFEKRKAKEVERVAEVNAYTSRIQNEQPE